MEFMKTPMVFSGTKENFNWDIESGYVDGGAGVAGGDNGDEIGNEIGHGIDGGDSGIGGGGVNGDRTLTNESELFEMVMSRQVDTYVNPQLQADVYTGNVYMNQESVPSQPYAQSFNSFPSSHLNGRQPPQVQPQQVQPQQAQLPQVHQLVQPHPHNPSIESLGETVIHSSSDISSHNSPVGTSRSLPGSFSRSFSGSAGSFSGSAGSFSGSTGSFSGSVSGSSSAPMSLLYSNESHSYWPSYSYMRPFQDTQTPQGHGLPQSLPGPQQMVQLQQIPEQRQPQQVQVHLPPQVPPQQLPRYQRPYVSNHTFPDLTTMVNNNTELNLPMIKAQYIDKFICSVCGKRVARDMVRHLRTHHAEPRFKCKFTHSPCAHKGQKFNRPYDYKKHLLNSHFTFDDPDIRRQNNLSQKLHQWGTCQCGQRFLSDDWLYGHVLGGGGCRDIR